jgi:hypothetical protein
MTQITGQLMTKQSSRKVKNTSSWKVILLVIFCSVVTGLTVNFFNNLHYSNLLLQANNQAGSAQTELGKEQYDVKFLINNNKIQFNCYDLRSDYARNICYMHENIPTKAQS